MRGCEVASRNDRTGRTEHLWPRELIRGQVSEQGCANGGNVANKRPRGTARSITERAPARTRLAMLADQVRVACGMMPVIFAGLPSDHPFRTRIREDACALLLCTGYLTEAELGTLSVTEATQAALQRLRGSPA